MSGYNKTINAQNVRIGNWLEEAKLQEETGVRFYASPKDRQSALMTKARVISHTEQVLPRDYTTVSRTTITDPTKHVEYGNTKPEVGPRRQRLDDTLRRMVDEEVERKTTQEFKESRKFGYSTVTQDSFRGRDGFTPTLRLNDVTVRHATKATNYATDTPVTYYSHAVSDPSVKVTFPMTFVGSINPFRKTESFSADIRQPAVARRTETSERPTPLPTVLEFKTLVQLRSKMLKQAEKVMKQSAVGAIEPGERLRFVLNTLLGPDKDFLPLAELERLIFNEMDGFQLTQAERDALCSAYDFDCSRRISMGDLCMFFKRTPVSRRLELINLFFSQFAGNHHDTVVSCESLKEAQRKNGSPSLQFCAYYLEGINPDTKEFSAEDFFDYFTDISSEIEEDDAFENYLKNTFE